MVTYSDSWSHTVAIRYWLKSGVIMKGLRPLIVNYRFTHYINKPYDYQLEVNAFTYLKHTEVMGYQRAL